MTLYNIYTIMAIDKLYRYKGLVSETENKNSSIGKSTSNQFRDEKFVI